MIKIMLCAVGIHNPFDTMLRKAPVILAGCELVRRFYLFTTCKKASRKLTSSVGKLPGHHKAPGKTDFYLKKHKSPLQLAGKLIEMLFQGSHGKYYYSIKALKKKNLRFYLL